MLLMIFPIGDDTRNTTKIPKKTLEQVIQTETSKVYTLIPTLVVSNLVMNQSES